MSDDYKQNIKDHSTWIRGLNMVLFSIVYSVTKIVLILVVIFQFLLVLLTRQTNDKLLTLGMNLSTFIYQILSYVTFNTNERPFPFSDFPDGEIAKSAPAASKKKAVKKPAKKKAVKKKIEKESDDSSASSEDINKTDD